MKREEEVPVAIPSALDGAPLAHAEVVGVAPSVASRAAHLASLQESLPEGLAQAFVEASHVATRRFWIVDNSSSMMTSDGSMILEGARGRKFVSCTRWEELRQCVLFHAELASRVRTRADFVLLNPQRGAGSSVKEFSCGSGDPERELARARAAMAPQACGGTPLCAAIREVTRRVRACAKELRERGELAVVVIASDGEASDGDVRAAMKPLAELPVWSIVRLCTSAESVVAYWNRIDADLEQQLEVLDDLASEAREVRALQPWLTYGEPVQRLREWGVPHTKLFDLLDERRLGASEIAEFARLVLGGAPLPHPQADWELFANELGARLSRAPLVLDPRTRRMKAWLDVKAIERACNPRALPVPPAAIAAALAVMALAACTNAQTTGAALIAAALLFLGATQSR